MDIVTLLGILIWNAIVFALYGIYKYKAVKRYWRISEKALIICAFLLGAPGAVLGMETFRHKTRKPLFRICIPLALFLNAGIFIYLERV